VGDDAEPDVVLSRLVLAQRRGAAGTASPDQARVEARVERMRAGRGSERIRVAPVFIMRVDRERMVRKPMTSCYR
jgi:hypothetical protein